MAGKPKVPSEDSTGRRALAEQRVKTRGAGRPVQSALDAERLFYELEVHQIELELQNEELRAAQLELERGFERYTELFDFAPIAYVTLRPGDLICELNHAAARLLGRQRSQLIGRPFSFFVAGREREHFGALVERAVKSQARQTIELDLQHGAQPSFPARVSASALGQGVPSVLLAVEDITEHRQREQQIERSKEALREADRRKDEFLAMLSHELRTPLTSIRNGVFVLERADPGAEQAKNAHAVVDRQVAHLTRLVDDLLDITRIRRGKIQLQCEPVELIELVRHTLEDLRGGMDASGIALHARLESGQLWLNADPARLVQIITNLLVNAGKFTPRGGSVYVELQKLAAHVVLVVRDTGAGIAPELLPQLFEPFVQGAQTIDRSRGGLGLGLSTVKGLVELHTGTIDVSSPGPGRGTEVRITMPLDGLAPVPRPSAPSLNVNRSRRVLVIEDNVDSANTLCDALAIMGHQVAMSYAGGTALPLAREFKPDVVICDLGLPGMDGYAVARAFRGDSTTQHVRLIAFSGYARPEDLQRSIEAGFDRHLAKPATLEVLGRMLAD